MSSEWDLAEKDPATAPPTTAIDMDLLRKVLPGKTDEKLAKWLKVLNDEEIETAEDARPLLLGNGATREEWNKLPLPMAVRAAIGDHLVSVLSPASTDSTAADAPPPYPGAPSDTPKDTPAPVEPVMRLVLTPDDVARKAVRTGDAPKAVSFDPTSPVMVPPPASPKTEVPPTPVATTTTTTTTTDKMTLTPVTEFPSIEAGNTAQEIYAMAHLQAPKLVDLEQRKKPLAISAVIDVSGSMSGTKLNMAKDSLKFMINELTDRDELGIIAFHTDVSEPLVLTKMDAEGKAQASAAADSLYAQSCTNLSGGLFCGMDQVRGNKFSYTGGDAYFADGSRRGNRRSPPKKPAGPGILQRMTEMVYGKPVDVIPQGSAASVTYYYTKIKRDGKCMITIGVEVTPNAACKTALTAVNPIGSGSSAASSHNHSRPLNRADPLKITWTIQRETAPATVDVNFCFAAHGSTATEKRTLVLDSEFKTDEFAFATAPKAAAASSDRNRAVLLFTDGQANGGITSEEGLVSAFKTKLHEAQNLICHTFGFGSDHNAALLQRVAETGSGSYYFIQDVNTMKESFADCLGGLLSTVAQNIELTIKPLPGFAIDRVMSSMPTSSGSGDAKVVKMTDVYSDEKRDVLVKLKMLKAQPVKPNWKSQMVSFSVKYDSLLSGVSETVDAVCSVCTSATKYSGKPNPDLDEQRTRIIATEVLDAARKRADSGDVAGARAQVLAARSELDAHCAHTAYAGAVLDDMLAVSEGMGNSARWASSGSKAAAQVQSCHMQQRSNCADTESRAGYGCLDNSWKGAMRAKSRKS